MVVEKLEHSRKKVTFDVTADEFEKALDSAFEQEVKKVTIKGFRAGKAPRSVFEKTYGEQSLYAPAIDVILNQKAQELYKDETLAREIVGQLEPIFDEDFKVTRGADFKIAIAFDVFPEVSLPQYKGIEVAKKVTVATEEAIDEAIKALVKKDVEMVAKEEQVIASGDHATFDFVGSVDGVEFPGGKADNYELQIGSGQFIPGFEDQMIGMKAEETKDVVVTFPENYQEASLAGKEAVFKVTVHEVKVEKTPELTDEYVKGLNIADVNNLEELKAFKKGEIEANLAVSEKDRQLNEIINKVLDNTVVDMPQALIDERVNSFKAQYENQAKMYNIPFETFLSLMGVDAATFEAEALKQGSRQALFNLVAEKIIEVEKLAPTKEQLEAKAEAEAKNGESKEVVLQKNFARFYSDLAYNALAELLLTNAVEI